MRAKKWEILLALFTGAVAGSGCAFAFGIASARADDVVEHVCDPKVGGEIVYELPDDEPATLARLSIVKVVSGRATQVSAASEKGVVRFPCNTFHPNDPKQRYVFSYR